MSRQIKNGPNMARLADELPKESISFSKFKVVD